MLDPFQHNTETNTVVCSADTYGLSSTALLGFLKTSMLQLGSVNNLQFSGKDFKKLSTE